LYSIAKDFSLSQVDMTVPQPPEFTDTPDREQVCAVLFLQKPPSPAGWTDWYLKNVTGVPYILLNALHLQAAGVDRLVIDTRDWPESEKARLWELAEDSRLRLTLELEKDPGRLKEILSRQCSLAVHGAALHDKKVIASALEANLSAEQVERVGLKKLAGESVEQVVDWEPGWDVDRFHKWAEGIDTEAPGRKLIWLAGDPATRIRESKDFRLQQERLLKKAGLGNDSLMDRWVTRHVSRHLTRWLVMTPITPNQITWMHMGVGLIAAWYFHQGTYVSGVVGAFLLMLSLWLDSTDGEVARLRFQQSRFGGMLDIVADNVVHVAVFWSIGAGLYQATGQVEYQYLGGVAVLGSLACFLLIQSAIFEKRSGGDDHARAVDDKFADQLANRDFIYFILAMALIGQLKIFIAVTAIGSLAFAGFIVYSKWRSGSGPGSGDDPKSPNKVSADI